MLPGGLHKMVSEFRPTHGRAVKTGAAETRKAEHRLRFEAPAIAKKGLKSRIYSMAAHQVTKTEGGVKETSKAQPAWYRGILLTQ